MKTLQTKFLFQTTFIAALLCSGAILSCGSTKKAAPAEPPPAAEKTPEPPVQDVVPEPTVEKTDDEYSRSVGNINVSRDEFVDDKEHILKIISELATVMKNTDYQAWLTYVDSESIKYWQKPENLKKAQSRLPVKGLKLNNLQDYFKYVFIPARAGRTVSEIRYISDTYIKAIQVQEEQDIVYYYFNKIDGKWMVHLPPLG